MITHAQVNEIKQKIEETGDEKIKQLLLGKPIIKALTPFQRFARRLAGRCPMCRSKVSWFKECLFCLFDRWA